MPPSAERLDRFLLHRLRELQLRDRKRIGATDVAVSRVIERERALLEFARERQHLTERLLGPARRSNVM